ncbi:hypothetical protein M0812_25058 [Anaeramoeba flamelloides]|uniref:ER membrane protein complex subunit 10 n=1 Tax=Anaeramoeba flamelloides TaxID=1746091 RepID=A0AAV7YP29_9EUKA|nr:hypothetical protein M0812_25058 [Anaeramoeba flamelloides]
MKLKLVITIVLVLNIVYCFSDFDAKNFFNGEWEIEIEQKEMLNRKLYSETIIKGRVSLRSANGIVTGEFYKLFDNIEKDFEIEIEPDSDNSNFEEEEEKQEQENILPTSYLQIKFDNTTSGTIFKRNKMSEKPKILLDFNFQKMSNSFISSSQLKPYHKHDPTQNVQLFVLSESCFLANVISNNEIRVIYANKPNKKAFQFVKHVPMALLFLLTLTSFVFSKRKGQQITEAQEQKQQQKKITSQPSKTTKKTRTAKTKTKTKTRTRKAKNKKKFK